MQTIGKNHQNCVFVEVQDFGEGNSAFVPVVATYQGGVVEIEPFYKNIIGFQCLIETVVQLCLVVARVVPVYQHQVFDMSALACINGQCQAAAMDCFMDGFYGIETIPSRKFRVTQLPYYLYHHFIAHNFGIFNKPIDIICVAASAFQRGHNFLLLLVNLFLG